MLRTQFTRWRHHRARQQEGVVRDDASTIWPPTPRGQRHHRPYDLSPIYPHSIHRSVSYQTTVTTFTGHSLTDLTYSHSQVSLLPISPNSIHRSVSYPHNSHRSLTHQATLTTFIGESLTHQPSQYSQISLLPSRHLQVSYSPINPHYIHRSASLYIYPHNIQRSVYQSSILSTSPGQSLTHQPSGYSQVSHQTINPHSIHRSGLLRYEHTKRQWQRQRQRQRPIQVNGDLGLGPIFKRHHWLAFDTAADAWCAHTLTLTIFTGQLLTHQSSEHSQISLLLI